MSSIFDAIAAAKTPAIDHPRLLAGDHMLAVETFTLSESGFALRYSREASTTSRMFFVARMRVVSSTTMVVDSHADKLWLVDDGKLPTRDRPQQSWSVTYALQNIKQFLLAIERGIRQHPDDVVELVKFGPQLMSGELRGVLVGARCKASQVRPDVVDVRWESVEQDGNTVRITAAEANVLDERTTPEQRKQWELMFRALGGGFSYK